MASWLRPSDGADIARRMTFALVQTNYRYLSLILSSLLTIVHRSDLTIVAGKVTNPGLSMTASDTRFMNANDINTFLQCELPESPRRLKDRCLHLLFAVSVSSTNLLTAFSKSTTALATMSETKNHWCVTFGSEPVSMFSGFSLKATCLANSRNENLRSDSPPLGKRLVLENIIHCSRVLGYSTVFEGLHIGGA